jgi:hypothetical protein
MMGEAKDSNPTATINRDRHLEQKIYHTSNEIAFVFVWIIK